ncbi:hypothetical protein [Streptomyces sp. NPDC004728]|uniref:hypothetical protein n=1 Tax=Streptomyces sp. NPDC004728 TaxID=3154289 RepID=UPI0033B5B7EB
MNADLNDAERQFLTFALDLAAAQMASRGDEFTEEDDTAMATFRRMATEPDATASADALGALFERLGPPTEHAAGLAELDVMRRQHPAPCRVPDSPDCTCLAKTDTTTP